MFSSIIRLVRPRQLLAALLVPVALAGVLVGSSSPAAAAGTQVYEKYPWAPEVYAYTAGSSETPHYVYYGDYIAAGSPKVTTTVWVRSTKIRRYVTNSSEIFAVGPTGITHHLTPGEYAAMGRPASYQTSLGFYKKTSSDPDIWRVGTCASGVRVWMEPDSYHFYGSPTPVIGVQNCY